MSVTLLHQDCMEYMAGLADGAFDLALVDPPYGIGMSGGVKYGRPSRPNQYHGDPKHPRKEWDSAAPLAEYFDELYRVSRNQIICGGNYFAQYLPPSMGWVYWGKMEDESNFSDGELIFTSFNRALKAYYAHQFLGTHGGKDRIHPTQKPVALYRWLLHNYAKPGWRILDTHLGSGSSAIAAHEMGFEFVGIEIDADYIAAARKRFDLMTRQTKLDL